MSYSNFVQKAKWSAYNRVFGAIPTQISFSCVQEDWRGGYPILEVYPTEILIEESPKTLYHSNELIYSPSVPIENYG
jgi:hypothetical protein